jgi:hypothetical protein
MHPLDFESKPVSLPARCINVAPMDQWIEGIEGLAN